MCGANRINGEKRLPKKNEYNVSLERSNVFLYVSVFLYVLSIENLLTIPLFDNKRSTRKNEESFVTFDPISQPTTLGDEKI